MIVHASQREVLAALADAAAEVVPVDCLGFARRLDANHVSVSVRSRLGTSAHTLDAAAVPENLLPPQPAPKQTGLGHPGEPEGDPLSSRLWALGARRTLSLPIPVTHLPSLLWLGTARGDPLEDEDIRALRLLATQAAGELDQPESPDVELSRLRRLAIVDDVLAVMIGVLDVRQVFTRLCESTAQALPHDAIGLPVLAEDGGHVIAFATAGTAPGDYPKTHPLPEGARRLFCPSWEYEIWDDLQATPEQDPYSARLGYRSTLRVPIRLEGRTSALFVALSKTPSFYREPDALVARRIADHVALALSHQRLAERGRHAEELRARTTTLELLDEMLAALVDTGELPDVFDRVSAIARKVLPHDTLLLNVVMPDKRHARIYASSGAGITPFPEVFAIPPSITENRDWEHERTDDLSEDPVWRHQESAKRGYRSALRVAIRQEGELLASLAFLSFAPAVYKEADLLVARRIRDRLALHLTQGRGAEAAKRAAAATARASQLELRVRALTEELNEQAGYRRVLGDSPSWRQVLTQAMQVAATDATVLLLGESGTGKEVIARFIHRASPRAEGRFVARNCAALPDQLLEAELFGYERGAFTGATQSKPGQLEQAAGGVLFLDEVGEMSLAAQAKFLRVLQEHEFQRLGGTRVLKTDVRLVAATNRDLHKALERGLFREDLFYRLNVFAIQLPPLRDRKDDVLPLSEAFVEEIGRSLGRPPAGLSREARQALLEYHWPGNVRELHNVLERAAILCDGGLITSEHLALRPAVSPAATATSASPSAAAHAARLPAEEPADLPTVERAMIVRALEQAGFNKSKAARALGVTRAQLYVRLRKHGLDKDDPAGS